MGNAQSPLILAIGLSGFNTASTEHAKPMLVREATSCSHICWYFPASLYKLVLKASGRDIHGVCRVSTVYTSGILSVFLRSDLLLIAVVGPSLPKGS